jgi:hypothetical protein
MWAAANKTIGADLAKHIGAHPMRPYAPHARHKATGLIFVLQDFSLTLVQSFLAILPFLPFWNGDVYSV